jgi:hypothetical protein
MNAVREVASRRVEIGQPSGSPGQRIIFNQYDNG